MGGIRVRTRIYVNGQPTWSESEPARARVAGYGSSLISHAITIGGSFVQGGPGKVERQRKAEREFKARHK